MTRKNAHEELDKNRIGAPVFDGDLFTDDVLANSAQTFKILRDLGDVVWMPNINMYVVARYRDVLACLQAADVLICGQGVTVNDQVNKETQPNASILTTDGMAHHRFKRLMMEPMGPNSMQALRPRLEREAALIVDELANGTEFEAMSKLSSYLPINIVADLVGIKDLGPKQMLRWSAAEFDGFGPADRIRTRDAIAIVREFVGYLHQLGRENVIKGSWADNMLSAGESGKLDMETARNLICDYVVPSLDTTIYATGEMLYQLATVPGAYDAVRTRPELIPGIVNEAVRLASPLRGFTRYASEDFTVSETTLPANSRVFLLHASANRDERHFPEPDTFDIERNPRDHLGWGHGTHSCMGIHLARTELEVLLQTIVQRVKSIKAGSPTRIINNALQGYATLPLTLHPD